MKSLNCTVPLSEDEHKSIGLLASLNGQSKARFLRNLVVTELERQSILLEQVKNMLNGKTTDLAVNGGE